MPLDRTLLEAVDRALPQTQCTRCGYPDCASYAHAIVAAHEAINRCPPGGDDGIRRLAALTGQEYVPLDRSCGAERARHVAIIGEAECIGCTLCIQACPVDAIVGAPQHMHTVITELCSGCDLCVAPCPVDCVAMVPAIGADAIWSEKRADAARQRYERRQSRLVQRRAERAVRIRERDRFAAASSPEAKRSAVAAALARARARRAAP